MYLITDLKTLSIHVGDDAPVSGYWMNDIGGPKALDLARRYRALGIGTWPECQRLAWREMKLAFAQADPGDALGYGPAFLRREHIKLCAAACKS
jgi:hypothetical protein